MRVLFLYKRHPVVPLGIMYLSSVLRRYKHKTKLAFIDDLDIVKEFKPNVIAASVMTGSQNKYLEIFIDLKKKFKFLSVMGGPHPTFFPEVIEEEGLDAIIRGEAEDAFLELVDKLKKKKDITKIKNVWIKKNGKIYKNDMRSLVEDLDSLPFPDRGIVYEHEFWKKEPIRHFIAGRGCPYNCSYCFNEEYSKLYNGKGKRVRWRSVSNLIKEIKEVMEKYPSPIVYFQDDTFILNKVWLREFSKEYKKEINLPYHCHVRANLVDEEICKLLKDSNCYSVHIAAETGDSELRNKILNRNMSDEEIYNASKLLRKYKIKFMMQNMIGLPNGNLKNDFGTLRMNIKCKPTYAWVSIFQPYPGTELSRLAIDGGYCSGEDLDRIGEGFFDESVMKIKNKDEVESLQKLFGITVEHPILYYTGLIDILIRLPKVLTKGTYSKWYKSFRNKKNNELYGVKLN